MLIEFQKIVKREAKLFASYVFGLVLFGTLGLWFIDNTEKPLIGVALIFFGGSIFGAFAEFIGREK